MAEQARMTRCPNCSSTFQVTEEQLSIASGAVRCGSCLQVFDALAHFIHAENLAFNDQYLHPNSTSTKTASNPFSLDSSDNNTEKIIPYDESWAEELLKELEEEDNDVFETSDAKNIKDLNEQIEAAISEDDITEGDTLQNNASFNQDINEHETDFNAFLDEDTDEDDIDISFFDQQLESLETLEGSKTTAQSEIANKDLSNTKAESAPNLSETRANNTDNTIDFEPNHSDGFGDEISEPLSGDAYSNSERSENIHLPLNDHNTTDESWVHSMLDELEGQRPDDPQRQDSHHLSESDRLLIKQEQEQQQNKSNRRNRAHNEVKSTRSISHQTTKKPPLPPTKTSEHTDTDTHHHSITKEDLYSVHSSLGSSTLDPSIEPTSRIRGNTLQGNSNLIKWSLLSSTATIILIAQFATHHFHSFAVKPNLRPTYQVACYILGCQLPDLIDIQKMQTNKLVVREHPTIKNALLVDIIMINKATFAQPFPDMGIEFSDINGKVIAYRRFTPREYKGDITIAKAPSGTPIHIALEIVSPGTNAVNYAIHFR